MKPNILGKRIKSLRIKNKMTQKEVGSILNYSESTISGWETAKREPSFDDLNALAKVFNVSADVFFNGNVEEVKAYQSKKDHYFSARLIKLYSKEQPGILTMFLLSILATLIAAYTYLDVVIYIAIIIWAIYLISHALLYILSFSVEKTTIHYPNNESLCFEHHLNHEKINIFQNLNTAYLIFSFIFGMLSLLFSSTMLSRVMLIDGADTFHLIVILIQMLLHAFLLIVEWTVAKRKRKIDYFVKAPFLRLMRFKVLIIFHTFIYIMIALTIAINGPSDQAIFNFIIPFFASANVLSAVTLYFVNNRFNKGYKVYAFDYETNKKTPIGV